MRSTTISGVALTLRCTTGDVGEEIDCMESDCPTSAEYEDSGAEVAIGSSDEDDDDDDND